MSSQSKLYLWLCWLWAKTLKSNSLLEIVVQKGC